MRIRSLIAAATVLAAALSGAPPAVADQAYPASWSCTPQADGSLSCTAVTVVTSVAPDAPGAWAKFRALDQMQAEASANYLSIGGGSGWVSCRVVKGKVWRCTTDVIARPLTPAPGPFPETWQHCATYPKAPTTIVCDALVTVKAKSLAEGNRLCRAEAADQAQALGYRNLGARRALTEKRPGGRIWCRVFLSFQLPKAST